MRCLSGGRAYCDATNLDSPVVIDEAQNCMARRMREYCHVRRPMYLFDVMTHTHTHTQQQQHVCHIVLHII